MKIPMKIRITEDKSVLGSMMNNYKRYKVAKHPQYGGIDVASEILFRHLNSDSLFIEEYNFECFEMLAVAHGWEIEIVEEELYL